MRSILIAAMLTAVPAAEATPVTADYWPNAPRNPYQANAVIARRLRCAALIEAVGSRYFGPSVNADPQARAELGKTGFDTPRFPPADARERQAYILAATTLYDAAETLGRNQTKYSHADFQSWFNDSNRLQALAKVRAGLGYAALASKIVRCFEYPQIAAIQSLLAARLKLPLPEQVPTASSRIEPNWMPLRTVGYLYRPDAYRFLGCAGLVHAVAQVRFGAMPPPDAPDFDGKKPADPGRALFRKAVRDTFLAGQKTLVVNNSTERQAYLMSFYAAARAGATLNKNGVAGEAAREPSLLCSELPGMAPVIRLLG